MRLKIREAQGIRMAMGRPVSLGELAAAAFPKKPVLSAKQCMRRLITGEATQIKLEALVAIAQTLEVSTDWLLGLKETY